MKLHFTNSMHKILLYFMNKSTMVALLLNKNFTKSNDSSGLFSCIPQTLKSIFVLAGQFKSIDYLLQEDKWFFCAL